MTIRRDQVLHQGFDVLESDVNKVLNKDLNNPLIHYIGLSEEDGAGSMVFFLLGCFPRLGSGGSGRLGLLLSVLEQVLLRDEIMIGTSAA